MEKSRVPMMSLVCHILNFKCDCDVQDRVSGEQLYLLFWHLGERSRLERKMALVILTWLSTPWQSRQNKKRRGAGLEP